MIELGFWVEVDRVEVDRVEVVCINTKQNLFFNYFFIIFQNTRLQMLIVRVE
jgi:hypothetical protein